MKKLLYVFAIIALSSCWHAPEQVNYGSSNRDSNNLQTPDKLGVWVSGQTTIFTKIKVAKSLNTNVVRHTIFLPVFTGTDKVYNQFTDSGLLVALTVSNKKGFGTAPEPFRKDTANFRAELESLLSNLPVKPLYIALDNEENSKTIFFCFGIKSDNLKFNFYFVHSDNMELNFQTPIKIEDFEKAENCQLKSFQKLNLEIINSKRHEEHTN